MGVGGKLAIKNNNSKLNMNLIELCNPKERLDSKLFKWILYVKIGKQ